MTWKERVEWCKTHKKEIALGAVGVVGAVVAGKLVYDALGTKSITITHTPYEVQTKKFDISVPDWGVGELDTVGDFVDEYVGAANDIPIADMGAFGAELIKNLDEVEADSMVSVIFGVSKGVSEM